MPWTPTYESAEGQSILTGYSDGAGGWRGADSPPAEYASWTTMPGVERYEIPGTGFEGQGASYGTKIRGMDLGDIMNTFQPGGYNVQDSVGGSILNPWTNQREQAYEVPNLPATSGVAILPQSVAMELNSSAAPWYLRKDGGGTFGENLVMLAALAAVGGVGAGGLTGGAGATGGSLGSGISLGATGANGLTVPVNALTSLSELSAGGLGAGFAGGTGAGLELGSGLLSAGGAFAPESLFQSLGISFPDYATSGFAGLSDLASGVNSLGSGLNMGGGGTGLRLPGSPSLTTMGGGSGITSPLLSAPVSSGGGGAFGGLEEMLKKLGIKLPGGGMASNALGVLSALRGLQGDSRLQKLAEQAMRAPDTKVIDPAGMGVRGPYLERLQQLYANPTSVTDLPGYKVGLDAVARRSAASGYLGSGNEKVQLAEYGNKFWGDEVNRLAGLAGMNFSPTVATGNAGAGISAASAGNDQASKALATLGYVLRSMNL